MRPIFGALVFTFIIFFNETETANRSTKNKMEDASASRASRALFFHLRRIEAAKKEKEKAFSEMLTRIGVNKPFKKEDEESPVSSQMLHRLELTKPSSSTAGENTDGTYGTSRATKRKLVPNPETQSVPKSEPNPRRTRDESNRLPTFEHVQNRSGGNGYEAHTNHYSRFPQPPPHVGGNSLTPYENTIGHVPGGMYMDNEGHYYQVPHHPPPLTGNHDYDHLHQFNGAIPPSGSSYSQSTQHYVHDHSFKFSGVASPKWPFSDPRLTQAYGQGLQNHQSSSYSQSTENHDNDFLLNSDGVSLPSKPSFAPPLPQNVGHDHLHPSHGGLLPCGPSSQHQGFHNHQSPNYYSAESSGMKHLNEYLRNQYPPNSGEPGSGQGSSHPYQK